MDQTTILILIAVLVLVPAMATVVSMCSYIGKVLAIKLLFKTKKGEMSDGEKEG